MSRIPASSGALAPSARPAGEPTLPTQRYCRQLLRRWYGQHDEVDLYAVQWRVARFLSAGEDEPDRWADLFLWAQRHGLLPAGEILSGSTADQQRSLMSCFVLPTQGAAFKGDGVNGLDHNSDQLVDEALRTLAMGGGVGYDFSAIAPRQSHPLLVAHIWQDPVSAMATLQDTRHLAMRRPGSEQIAVLRCDHPDIERLLSAVRHGHLDHIRTAIAVSDAFMRAASRGEQIELVHPAAMDWRSDAGPAACQTEGSPWGQRDARMLWREMLQCAHEHGGPSLLFMDRMQAENNLSYCEQIEAISPHGEQPLPAYGSSPLAAIDLTRCVHEPFRSGARWNIDVLRQLVPLAVRMLDNALDLTPWPLSRQRQEALSKRRIGLGVTGLADALVMMGLSYGSPPAIAASVELVSCLRDLAYEASCQLAIEKGSFPLLDAEALLQAPHAASRLPAHIQQTIRRTGLRNSHLLSLAPAEAISLACADNTSAGIAPPASLRQALYMRDADGYLSAYELTNHALRMMHHVPPATVEHHLLLMNRTQEVEPEDQLAMLAALTPLVDAGVSLAMRTDAPMTYQRFESLCWAAWRAGLKGWHGALRPASFTQDGQA